MKQVLVTGGSRGIGASIAHVLGASGWRVWLNYRARHDAAQRVADGIVAEGGPSPILAPFDVADRVQTAGAIRALLEEHGTPDALVINAGMTRDGLFVFTDDAAWDEVIDTNLGGFFSVAKPVVKAMLRARRGRIVVLSSVAGQRGSPGQVNYSASKGGLIAAARALALETAPRGLTVNVVAPGLVETQMLEGAPVEQLLPLVPLGRVGKPEEVAHVVRFLCSDEASYVTGQVLGINGGMWM